MVLIAVDGDTAVENEVAYTEVGRNLEKILRPGDIDGVLFIVWHSKVLVRRRKMDNSVNIGH